MCRKGNEASLSWDSDCNVCGQLVIKPFMFVAQFFTKHIITSTPCGLCEKICAMNLSLAYLPREGGTVWVYSPEGCPEGCCQGYQGEYDSVFSILTPVAKMSIHQKSLTNTTTASNALIIDLLVSYYSTI